MVKLSEWYEEVERELTGNESRLLLLHRIKAMRNEADAGQWSRVYGDTIEIANPELSDLVFFACAENWLMWLADEEGREGDCQRHSDRYENVNREIWSDRFTAEEQVLAYKVLD